MLFREVQKSQQNLLSTRDTKINGRVIAWIKPLIACWYVGDNVPGWEIVFKFSNFSLKLWFLAKYSFLDNVSAADIFRWHTSRLKGSLVLLKFFFDCHFKAWYDSPGIAVDGCLLTYMGPNFCNICKSGNRKNIHSAKFKSPFTPETPRFEVCFWFIENYLQTKNLIHILPASW